MAFLPPLTSISLAAAICSGRNSLLRHRLVSFLALFSLLNAPNLL